MAIGSPQRQNGPKHSLRALAGLCVMTFGCVLSLTAVAQVEPPSADDGWVDLESLSPTANSIDSTQSPSDDGWRDLETLEPLSPAAAPSPSDGWVDLESSGQGSPSTREPSIITPVDDPNDWIYIEQDLEVVTSDMTLPTGRLAAGEIVDIAVKDAESLSGAFKISSIGTLVLPLIGAVAVEGLSAIELEAQLEALYAVDYLVDPEITVSARAKVLGDVTLKGRVTRPQSLSMTSVESLAKVISRSGGLSGDPAELDAIILRSVSDTIRARRVSLAALDETNAPGPTILPGDQITILTREKLPEIKDETGDFPLLETVLNGKALPNF